jgi:hypothetical protein
MSQPIRYIRWSFVGLIGYFATKYGSYFGGPQTQKKKKKRKNTHTTFFSNKSQWEIITVHAPHPPSPHPNLVPVSPTPARKKAEGKRLKQYRAEEKKYISSTETYIETYHWNEGIGARLCRWEGS